MPSKGYLKETLIPRRQGIRAAVLTVHFPTASLQACKVELRLAHWQGRCVLCKEDPAEMTPLLNTSQASNVLRFMQSCASLQLPHASLQDLEAKACYPSSVAGCWPDRAPMSIQAFVNNLESRSWASADNDHTQPLWPQIRAQLAKGAYVKLHYYPRDTDTAFQRFIDSRMADRCVSWYNDDLDLHCMVLVLISPSCVAGSKERASLWQNAKQMWAKVWQCGCSSAQAFWTRYYFAADS
ncbi:hypothetical protein WJX73_003781 [Symbiochloris irregularis]|uniref:Uncharacterized protein n=1 Tax=Symbiochloris irregularis TaxID=706552 RepID=A0AAW1P505_9CHLO